MLGSPSAELSLSSSTAGGDGTGLDTWMVMAAATARSSATRAERIRHADWMTVAARRAAASWRRAAAPRARACSATAAARTWEGEQTIGLKI